MAPNLPLKPVRFFRAMAQRTCARKRTHALPQAQLSAFRRGWPISRPVFTLPPGQGRNQNSTLGPCVAVTPEDWCTWWITQPAGCGWSRRRNGPDLDTKNWNTNDLISGISWASYRVADVVDLSSCCEVSLHCARPQCSEVDSLDLLLTEDLAGRIIEMNGCFFILFTCSVLDWEGDGEGMWLATESMSLGALLFWMMWSRVNKGKGPGCNALVDGVMVKPAPYQWLTNHYWFCPLSFFKNYLTFISVYNYACMCYTTYTSIKIQYFKITMAFWMWWSDLDLGRNVHKG